jgi:HlyD family secretion protein
MIMYLAARANPFGLRGFSRFVPALCAANVVATAVLSATVSAAQSEIPGAPAGMSVSVIKSKHACFSDAVAITGIIVPRSEVLVRPDREGLQIKEILAEAGDTVTSAQVLARLSPPSGQQGSAVSIRAPVGGIVLAAPTVVGETASARGEPLFRIAAEGDLELSAEVPANGASRLAAGQSARIKTAGMEELSGRVRLVSTTIDPTTQLGRVRIALEHNSGVRVGAFARATVDCGQSCGVAVPLSALLFGPDGPVVQLVRDDRIETRRVVIGLSSQNSVQIRDGLSEGELVITRAGAFLREGDHVRPAVVGE